ncbi:integrin alpha-10 isoform 12-T12 [Morphnus guianensis]
MGTVSRRWHCHPEDVATLNPPRTKDSSGHPKTPYPYTPSLKSRSPGRRAGCPGHGCGVQAFLGLATPWDTLPTLCGDCFARKRGKSPSAAPRACQCPPKPRIALPPSSLSSFFFFSMFFSTLPFFPNSVPQKKNQKNPLRLFIFSSQLKMKEEEKKIFKKKKKEEKKNILYGDRVTFELLTADAGGSSDSGAMEDGRCRWLLPMLLLLPGLCVGFNVDVRRPWLFHGPAEAQFGYKVLQRAGGGEKWLLVGAPWDSDRQGDVYKCRVGPPNTNCTKANLGSAAPWLSPTPGHKVHFGMTLLDSKDGGFVACAPLWSQACGTSVFSTGICARLDGDLRPVGTIAPTAQRCSTYMDIVIVLDGSNSIYPWYEVQNFLSNILSKFFIGPGQIQVGVLQYGEQAVHEWVLGRYQTAEEVVEAAKNISRQEGRETRTAFAIHQACTEAFSPERGGRADATRLMIVVTDGESHDGEELPEALAECEKHNVTRYAIAVLGHYLRRQQDPEDFIREIKYIASDPDEKYFFNVTDEAALNDIVDALGDRIFSLEGTHGYNESSFELEMSQIGFSLHLLEDGILFGTVGAYDWDGAVLEESRRGRIIPPRKAFEKEFPLELKNHVAYLGYAVSSLRLPGGQRLYVAGAPRFQHKGKVILFEMGTTGTVTVAQALTGEQIGSYFGSEVCALDVDSDGVTDVLLVAAPMYLGAQSRETGRVYLYRVGQRLLAPAGTLHANKKPQDSRFGYALAAVPDLNHDGFNDVVVGAPLEDGHRGAIYVYHGAPGTLLPNYKQHIEAAVLGPTLSYFGRSVDGQLDLDGDGLVDLAVGAQGVAVLLRSRQIVQINTSLTVEPPAINVIQKNCQRSGTGAVCLRARVCFRAGTRARVQQDREIELRYNVSLEERTPGARAAFDSGARRLLQRRLELSLGRQSCLRFPFHVLDTTDYLRPLSFTVRLAMAESTGPVLDERSPTTIRKLIPFFKDCGEDDKCVTDLVLRATMDIVGSRQSPHVLRKGRRKVVVDVVLENKKENAYNASLLLRFSNNLHFSSLTLQDTSPVKLECTALPGHRRLCSVGYPVFRSLAKVGDRATPWAPVHPSLPADGPACPQVSFTLELEFSCSVLLDRAEVTLEASSDSTEVTVEDNTVQLSAPIRYEPDLFLSSDANLHRYEVHPLGTFPHGPGPEFKTTVKVRTYGGVGGLWGSWLTQLSPQVQNFGCYPVQNITLHMALPALGYRHTTFLSVTRVLADNATCMLRTPPEEPWQWGTATVVPVHPEDLLHVDRLDCSNAWCQELSCRLGRLDRGGEVSIHILRTIHNDFFRGAKFRSVKVISTTWLGVPKSSVLLLEEGAHRREMVLEIIQGKRVPISLWILVGSILGGLLLLALIIFCLWKLGFFTRKKLPKEEEEKEEQ